MKIELHCHSHYSRGKKIPWEAFMSPRDIIKAAKDKGIFGVAITDHNSSESWKHAKRAARDQGTLFIPGIEISTLKGHVIGLGLNEHVSKGLSIEETVEKIHEQGGIAVAPHPFDIKGEGIKNDMEKVDVVEVFSSMNMDRLSNRLALNKAGEFGKRMVVGSDAHTEEMLGLAVNEADAYDLDDVMKAIRSGNIEFQTRYATMPMILNWSKERFIRSYMDVMKHINKNYSAPKAWVAKGMLRRFILSKNRSWDSTWKLIANFGLGCSYVYGGVRFLTYY
jgi:predicted metal-dependent phosphoesterase TrpH